MLALSIRFVTVDYVIVESIAAFPNLLTFNHIINYLATKPLVFPIILDRSLALNFISFINSCREKQSYLHLASYSVANMQ